MPTPSVRSLLALSFLLTTSVMKALNFFRYLDNKPVVIHCITSIKSIMVSVVGAGGLWWVVFEPEAFLAVLGIP